MLCIGMGKLLVHFSLPQAQDNREKFSLVCRSTVVPYAVSKVWDLGMLHSLQVGVSAPAFRLCILVALGRELRYSGQTKASHLRQHG